MTTNVQTLVKDRLTLNTATTAANLSPGNRLTDSEMYQTLNKVLPANVQTATATAGTPAATAGNDDTVITDPGEPITYQTGFSDWLMNNPGLATGIGLLIAWGLYQLFTSKKRR